MRSHRVFKVLSGLPVVLVGAAVVGLLLPAAPAAAADGGYGLQDRGPSIVADLVALVSIAAGSLALARVKGRFGGGSGRVGALVAMAAAVIAIAIAAVALAVADGGPGTGNGVVGSAFAIVLGLVGLILGGVARARSVRQADTRAGTAGAPSTRH